MDIKKLLGKRIQEIRKYNNLTQEALAEMVNMDTSSISHIENGKYYPTAENLEKIIEVLHTKPSEIFDYEGFEDNDKMVDEMVEAMRGNDKLIKQMYKFYSAIKYNC